MSTNVPCSPVPLDKSTRGTPTILCIDDNPDVSYAIELHLRAFDVRVVRAFHGMHGFAEASRHHPDLIVMDLAMPNGDGATILECIRRNARVAATPVIILTAMRDPVLKRRLFALGADGFLSKPLSFDDLAHEISRFVDLHPREESGEESTGEQGT